jgi:RNA polymerase sigma-70 factor (ECF subfamily)
MPWKGNGAMSSVGLQLPSVHHLDDRRHDAVAADRAAELYGRYSRQIYSFCLSRLRDPLEAEDAAQSTFLNAFRAFAKGSVPEFESAWLYRIATNVCFSRQRAAIRRRRVEAPTDLATLENELPDRSPDADELLGLGEALGDIPERQRQALLLREWQGLSYCEIAEALDLSQSAVETLLFRARRSLSAALAQPEKPGDGVAVPLRRRD